MADFPALPSLPLETERSIGEVMESPAAGGNEPPTNISRVPSDFIMPPNEQAVAYIPPITINAQITLIPAGGNNENNEPERVTEKELNIRQSQIRELAPVVRDDSAKKRKLKLVLVCSWLILLIPSLVMIVDYIAAVQLMRYIDSSRSDYSQAKKVVKAMSKQTILNQAIICNASDASDTDLMFAKFASESGDCNCLGRTVDCSKSYSTYSSYTTSNVAQTCSRNANANLSCTECSCGNWSSYNTHSVQYQFALQSVSEKDTTVCSLSDMTEASEKKASKDKISITFNHCYNSAFAFLVISGIVMLLTCCGGFKVRTADISMAWQRVSQNIFQTEKLYEVRSRLTISRDGFAVFICTVVAFHILGDVPQSIVAIIFTIYKQGTCDCLVSWSKSDFANQLQPPMYHHGHTILNIVSQYPAVVFFLGFAFANVFISGILGIRLFDFDTQKLCEYPLIKTFLYFLLALLCGVVACLVIFAPFWGACWRNAEQLQIGGPQKQATFYTFVAGMSCWGLLMCMPLCFSVIYSIWFGAGGCCGCC